MHGMWKPSEAVVTLKSFITCSSSLNLPVNGQHRLNRMAGTKKKHKCLVE